MTRLLDPAVRKSGIRCIRLRDLHHTHASLLLATASRTDRIVNERRGHETPAFTMSVYAHSLPGQQQDTADVFGAMLASDGRAEEAESEAVQQTCNKSAAFGRFSERSGQRKAYILREKESGSGGRTRTYDTRIMIPLL